MKINNRTIGPGHPVYIIAELSANHGQDFDCAVEMIHQAHRAGADAVKLQTYTADTLTIDSDQPYFQIQHDTAWDGQSLYELYQQAYTPWEWQGELKRIANQLGLDLFSSPFDESSVNFLETLDIPAYKIASFELVDIPLLKIVGRQRRPVIMSTGMSTIDEIELAVETLYDAGAPDVALLKCTSAYPAPPETMNLRTIPDLAFRFQLPVGLSDHTLTNESAIVAVSLGASIVEKHFTLSRADGGPDSGFSLEPDEFKQLVVGIRAAEAAIGIIHYGPTISDAKNVDFRRSLFVVQDVKEGEPFTSDNVRSIRPGQGMAPKHLEDILDKTATEPILRGTPLSWKHVA